MQAVIVPTESLFATSALKRGFTKLDTVELVTYFEREVKVEEKMTAAEAFRHKYIDEEELDKHNLMDMITVEVIRPQHMKESHNERRLVEKESTRRSRRVTKHLELVHVVNEMHPLATQYVKIFVNDKIKYYAEHHYENPHPHALVFLKFPKQDVNLIEVDEDYVVVSWEHSSARIMKEGESIRTVYFTPEILNMTVTRDGIMYFPACVKLVEIEQ